MKNRNLVMLLTLVMVISIFATGCSKKESETMVPTENLEAANETKEVREAAETVVEKTQVVYYGWTDENKTEQMNTMIENFEELNPDIDVIYEVAVVNDSVASLEKIDLLTISGEPVDIISTPNLTEYVLRAQNGMLADLTPMLEAEGVTYDAVYTASTAIDDKYYSLPYEVKTWLVYLNQKHLEEAGLDTPPLDWTWEDYREYAIKLTKGEGAEKRFGSYMHTWDKYLRLAAFNAIEDNHLYKEDMTANFDHPHFAEYLQYKYDLEYVDKAQMPYHDAKAAKAAYTSEFTNESASMLIVGSWMIPNLVDLEIYPHDFVTTFAPMPKWGDSVAGRTFTETSYIGISENSQNKEAAYRFLRYMTTDGYADLNGFGFSAEVGADNAGKLQQMLSVNTEMVDMDALTNVLDNRIDNMQNRVDENVKLFETIYKEEAEIFLAEGGNVDEVIAKMMERAENESK